MAISTPRATGKSKPTIAKAIKRGQISAVKAADGSYQIDPAELHRVYPMASERTGNRLREDTPIANGGVPDDVEVWRALATERAEVIRDLRARLDAADARIDRLMLSDRHERPRPWWRRWFR